MKNNCAEIKKSCNISYRTLLILSLAVAAVSLIPLFLVSNYNVPAADDFSFSCETHAAVLNGGTFFSVLSGAAQKVKNVYYSWQGTFSAIFLMALQPSIWGFQYYSITAYIMIFSLLLSIFFFCARFFTGVFRTTKFLSGIIASIIFFAWVQFLPSPNQGFFWYNSSVYYTFTYAVMLTSVSVATGYLLYGGRWRLIILCVLFIIVGASNFVTALISSVLILVCIGLLVLCKSKKWTGLIIPSVFLLASFALSIIAPGNQTRQALFTEHPEAVASVLLSFSEALKAALRWVDLRYLFFLLLIFPFVRAAAVSSERSAFRYPGAVTGFSFCLLSAMFTPQIYSMGSAGPERLQNIIYFTFVLLSAVNLFWWIGWFRAKKRKKSTPETKNSISIQSVACFVAAAFVSLAVSVFVSHQPMTSVVALGELRSGEAKEYYEEALVRQDVLEDESISDCEFSPYANMPSLLYFTDMTDDPDYYENQDACTYYGKTSIIVK